MPFLLDQIVNGEPAVTRVEGDSLRIGRGTNADLRLEEPSVALEHAKIERDAAGYRLTDWQSVTGTYLNGKAVDGAYLADGDSIELGGVLLKAGWSGPGEPLRLTVRPVAAEGPAPAAGAGSAAPGEPAAASAAPLPVKVPEIDYLGAYRLRRPLLTQGFLALLLTAAALLAALALPLVGAYGAFQPGEVSEAHRKEMQIKHPTVSCAGCHRPWSGPVEQQCLTCHADKQKHQPRQAFDPPCADCHLEHRAAASLALVNDGRCVDCHGDLTVKGRESGAVPAVARRITSFPAGHADFSVTLAPGRRLPVGVAAATRADPARLKFGHLLHLGRALKRPDGTPAALRCESCHEVAEEARPTGMKPVRYQAACAACHPLTFDPRLGDQQAPHGDATRVREFLVRTYSDRRDATLSGREIRSRMVRGTAPLAPIDLSARASRAVIEAERYLYGSACGECHDVDLDAPVPRVTKPALPGQWLPYSRFAHSDHQIEGLQCVHCHTTAAASRETADVLIPGIAACGGCHGGSGRPPGQAEVRTGSGQCRGCHDYHPAHPAARR